MHACDDKHAMGTQTEMLAQIYTIQALNVPYSISLEIDRSATLQSFCVCFPPLQPPFYLSRPFSLHTRAQRPLTVRKIK